MLIKQEKPLVGDSFQELVKNIIVLRSSATNLPDANGDGNVPDGPCRAKNTFCISTRTGRIHLWVVFENCFLYGNVRRECSAELCRVESVAQTNVAMKFLIQN